MSIKIENSEKPSFSFSVRNCSAHSGLDLALAVGDENDIAFFEARLTQAIERRVERLLKIGAAAGKVFRQVHNRLGFNFVAVARVHVEDLQRCFGRGETDRAKQAALFTGDFEQASALQP